MSIRLGCDVANTTQPIDSDASEAASFGSTIPESSPEDDGDEGQLQLRNSCKENANFQCMDVNDGNLNNPNTKTIEILQKMATYYDRTGDHWRTTAYRKAITALRKQKDYISTKEKAVAIPQIGARLAEKIEEIATTSKLKRLDSTEDDPNNQALQLFMGSTLR